MRFVATELEGVWRVEAEPIRDERGGFMRLYCEREFGAHGLNTCWPQWNLSCNTRRGTLRGLHFQVAPSPETKLVQCVRGRIFDVVVDVRRDRASFGRWQGFELIAETPVALYIPAGFAHGFQCVADDTDVLYHMSEFYAPELTRGVRWDDPELAITWPVPTTIQSPRDAALPLLSELCESS